MKRLFLVLSLLVIGCSDTLSLENCDCNLNITSDLPHDNGVYELEYNSDLAQTYSILNCQTDCGWSQHIQWDSDYSYQIQPNQWVSLVNPASMTDEFGEGSIVFAVWEEFIGHTITIYGGYTDDCGHHLVDSIKVKVIDNE